MLDFALWMGGICGKINNNLEKKKTKTGGLQNE